MDGRGRAPMISIYKRYLIFLGVFRILRVSLMVVWFGWICENTTPTVFNSEVASVKNACFAEEKKHLTR